MRTAFFLGLCIFWSLTVPAQTVLPNWLIDSMAFEVRLGRSCDSLQRSQADLIQKQGLELVANGTALQLSTNQITTLEQMNSNLKQQYKLQGERFIFREKENKRKLRKRTVVIIGQAVVIVLLLI